MMVESLPTQCRFCLFVFAQLIAEHVRIFNAPLFGMPEIKE